MRLGPERAESLCERRHPEAVHDVRVGHHIEASRENGAGLIEGGDEVVDVVLFEDRVSGPFEHLTVRNGIGEGETDFEEVDSAPLTRPHRAEKCLPRRIVRDEIDTEFTHERHLLILRSPYPCHPCRRD
jgi:hypothetical protein